MTKAGVKRLTERDSGMPTGIPSLFFRNVAHDDEPFGMRSSAQNILEHPRYNDEVIKRMNMLPAHPCSEATLHSAPLSHPPAFQAYHRRREIKHDRP